MEDIYGDISINDVSGSINIDGSVSDGISVADNSGPISISGYVQGSGNDNAVV